MTTCTHHSRAQAFLDGDLPVDEARAFREHLAGCAGCVAELAAYRRVFALLDEAPLAVPRIELTERVLARVLPSRVRQRRLRAFGWSYAGALSACLAGGVTWAMQPAGQAALSMLTAEASRRLFDVTKFVVQSASFGLVHLASGSHAMIRLLEPLAPLGRALGAVLGQTSILATLVAAVAVCAAMLWWLRPRDGRPSREIRHVGVLGF